MVGDLSGVVHTVTVRPTARPARIDSAACFRASYFGESGCSARIPRYKATMIKDYGQLSDVDNAQALLAQGRAMHQFATSERIPLVMGSQIYERYVACGLPTHRVLSGETAHLALAVRDFADGTPWGEWLAEWTSEAAYAYLAAPGTSRATVAGALLLAHNGYYVNGEVLVAARPLQVQKFCPPAALRYDWVRRRIVTHAGTLSLCDADAALAAAMPLDRLRALALAHRPEGVREISKAESALLTRKYPFLREYDARPAALALFDERAIVAAVEAFDDFDAAAICKRVATAFDLARRGY